MQRTKRQGRERGAILVVTTISMVVLLGFSAFAVDLGQRAQRLAGAQHAIDAAVITGAQYLSAHDADYTGASARIKEVIRQNLGIAVSAWVGCQDADHLDVSANADTNCISFRRTAGTSTTATKNDIRVRLPRYSMDTIFGSVFGVDSIDLAAAAASNGANCPTGMTCSGGGPTTTAKVMSAAEAACRTHTILDFALVEAYWAPCAQYFPNDNRVTWERAFCASSYVTFVRDGVSESWVFSPISRYVWYWTGLCDGFISPAERDAFLRNICTTDLPTVFSQVPLWTACKAIFPSMQTMAEYAATTTTTTTTTKAPTTTSATTSVTTTTRPTTTVAPTTTIGISVPTSLDLSN